jgi:D-alanine-D-alanine ligase
MVVTNNDDLDSQIQDLAVTIPFPLFVKPAKAGDSLGIDERSLVHDVHSLKSKIQELLNEYDEVLVEQYIAGREFTVLVSATERQGECIAYRPLEYCFPEDRSFKTYELKTSELHPDCNVPCSEIELDASLRDAAQRIFRGFSGVGYARMDFRVNSDGTIYFLEVNFTCSVFYEEEYEGSADHILNNDPATKRGFLLNIIDEGIARHKRVRKCYELRGNALSGYGIYALRAISKNEVVFRGEERSQRIATRRWIDQRWSEGDKEYFRRYAYPISKQVYILWDADPMQWAPQNHSCSPNTLFDGLNVVAKRDIERNEELTIDYTMILDETATPFECRCGSANCRRTIRGSLGNTLTQREDNAQ